jgi:chemotaxis protein CheD
MDHRDAVTRVAIHSGEFFVSTKNIVITTLLGSCISACLYDPVHRVVGMNHFLLGSRRDSKDLPMCVTEAGRYGVHAMELVINGMFALGARRKHIRAKVFGGASMYPAADGTDDFYRVGEINIRFIHEFLKRDHIPLMASDLGGEKARVIYFSSADFSVLVRRVRRVVQPKLAEREKQYWLKSVKDEGKGGAEPEIWTRRAGPQP